MSRHLFPVKLFEILRYLNGRDVLIERSETTLPPLNWPDDGKTRYAMYSSEVHNSIPDIEGYPSTEVRKRLAIPNDMNFAAIMDVMFEIYDKDGNLIYSEKVIKLTGYLSAAIEVELLFMVLQVRGLRISAM